ncbi:FtsH protease activity modulator HflK [Hyphomicrobium sp.]|uniref:FtsH protease activity modulator HflK n=1 Tax=Hyphomicrobium sp. TaxID=82 RepID=UPI002BCF0F49|nr:FtsH protease activity modulator HflK [Hyphomicrobium sp.]HRQ27711.1 FtsH protease activity modulator HflK [Hyphomicrobium sp.]
MPWSNQSGGGSGGGGNGGGWKGGSGGGGGGPWGQGPGSQPPDLEEMLKRSQDRMKQVMHGGGVPGPLAFLAAAVAVAVIGWYAFTFRVDPDELGVVMRFGEYVDQRPPGLHFRLPYPIEEIIKPKVTRQNIIEVGMRSGTDRGFGGVVIQDVPEESLMLTGDENTVDIDFVVYWRIRDAAEYLFNIQNPDNTVKEVAESAMREIVGKSRIQPILTEARQKTEADVLALIQQTLDGYKAGIQIDQVTLQKVDPPGEVIDAFRDVQAARADQERLQNEAFAYANKVVPEARGEAERILQGAEGFKQQTVAEAQGQTARFISVYDQYTKAPEVTRKRIFLETMERVFGGTDKVIIDSSSGQGVVPYLPLDQLQRRQPAQAEGGN